VTPINPPPFITQAIARAQADGFLGELAGYSLNYDEQGHHAMALVSCRFPCGGRSSYLVVADLHENGGQPRLHSIAHAVHVLQNVGDVEQWTIAARLPAIAAQSQADQKPD
jgi:hypothetical protein